MEAVGAPPETKMLDIILYSREQLIKERDAMASKQEAKPDMPDAPWGIISIKAQDEDHELPMQPITMMRNAYVSLQPSDHCSMHVLPVPALSFLQVYCLPKGG